ncbi:MAG: Mrp/NBP35 family ATP-binding protein [Chitinophagales bacterium]|nr:Mrp/NBP35 family ATP-binding protein [Chitinophagales bacterium]
MKQDDILDALKVVIDPDFRKNLVELNMIKNIVIDGKRVAFDLELTTPACPIREKLRSECVEAVKSKFEDANVEVNLTSNVTTKRNSNINILPNVKNIICVASGKGGVGKSTVSVNLAVGLAKTGAKVGLIDADIHGPSIPLMLGIKNERPVVREIKGKHYLKPVEKHGISVLSIGVIVDERQAVVWRGPMVTSALKQFVTDVLWGNIDYLIMDLPPGTGDVHLTMVQTVPVTASIIVTTPQQVAMADARKAISMFRMPNINVPIIGLIENMSYFTPEDMPDKKYHIFGEGGGKKLADEYEIPFLGELPIISEICSGGDNGLPTVDSTSSPILKASWKQIVERTAQQLAMRNANLEPTKIVEVTNY